MKRRTLDILFSAGGALLAIALLVLSLVLFNQASFAKDYVRDQLSQQQIYFTATDKLTAEEAKASCLVTNGGKLLTTGKQAECYANSYIGLHVKNTAGGQTYAQLGSVQTDLRAKVAEATKVNDPQLTALQSQLTTVNGQRDTLFRGETLRGLLLSSYGFSIFGDRAGLAAWVALAAAVILALATLAGFIHALTTPRNQTMDGLAVDDGQSVRTPAANRETVSAPAGGA